MPDQLHAFVERPSTICIYVHGGKQTNIQPHRCSLEAKMTGWRGAELSWGESQEAAQGFLRGTDSAHGMAWHGFTIFDPFRPLIFFCICLCLCHCDGPPMSHSEAKLIPCPVRADDSDSTAPCSKALSCSYMIVIQVGLQ